MTKANPTSKHTNNGITQIRRAVELARLRRIALGNQGLLQAAPFGRGLAAVRKAIRHTGYVQIDTISVVQRAHHHVLRSRVPNYHPQMLHRLLHDRHVFEYWSHAAAFLPIEDYRFSLPYKHAIKSGKRHWFRSRDKKLMRALLQRIRSEGPLRSRDVEENKGTGAGWWAWKPAKRALEQLYMQGDLMIAARHGFQKTYDLTERILPANLATSMPTTAEYAQYLINQELRCHGLVSLKGITYQRRDAQLRAAVKQQIDAGIEQQTYQRLQLANGEIFLHQAGSLDSIPRANNRLSILSPFDNSVIQRARLQTLFNFDYQIECYVPQAKRRYGYFCLPLLYRDQFIGRVDAKAHRQQRRLELKLVQFETLECASEDVMAAFADALPGFLQFQECDRVTLGTVSPTSLRAPLTATLQQHAFVDFSQ